MGETQTNTRSPELLQRGNGTGVVHISATPKNDRVNIAAAFNAVRCNTMALAEPLSPEDWLLQSMEEASPIKWHLAHTSWFFETFILLKHDRDYREFHPQFSYLFNSYYHLVGSMHRRARRGLLSRPTAQEVRAYRGHVDQAINRLIEKADDGTLQTILPLIEVGCVHEEQHQELMQTDILHAFYQNSLLPAAYEAVSEPDAPDETDQAFCEPLQWVGYEGGLIEVGADGEGFAFDNEFPRHKYYLNPFEIMNRPVTNRDYLHFIEDGGYTDSQHWLSDGWAQIQADGWETPLYWRRGDDQIWYQFTLFGERPLPLDGPVRHISFYEAAAYASWAGVWLPTEREWEHAAAHLPVDGHFLEEGRPRVAASLPAGASSHPQAMFGTVWEWTQSSYTPYPGYRPAPGAIGEYNGKFMSNQMVLRGGSAATPIGHIRATYRNFFPPDARWQFSGLRLVR